MARVEVELPPGWGPAQIRAVALGRELGYDVSRRYRNINTGHAYAVLTPTRPGGDNDPPAHERQ